MSPSPTSGNSSIRIYQKGIRSGSGNQHHSTLFAKLYIPSTTHKNSKWVLYFYCFGPLNPTILLKYPTFDGVFFHIFMDNTNTKWKWKFLYIAIVGSALKSWLLTQKWEKCQFWLVSVLFFLSFIAFKPFGLEF